MEGIRLDTSTHEVDGYKVLDVAGEVDVYTAPTLKEALSGIISAGQSHLIVDIGRVTYMDSSGFGTLLSAVKRVRPEGGTVNLVKCSSAIDRMLKLTRLNTIFNIHSSIEEAINAIRQTTPAEGD